VFDVFILLVVVLFTVVKVLSFDFNETLLVGGGKYVGGWGYKLMGEGASYGGVVERLQFSYLPLMSQNRISLPFSSKTVVTVVGCKCIVVMGNLSLGDSDAMKPLLHHIGPSVTLLLCWARLKPCWEVGKFNSL
jgi:hypothetical protein